MATDARHARGQNWQAMKKAKGGKGGGQGVDQGTNTMGPGRTCEAAPLGDPYAAISQPRFAAATRRWTILVLVQFHRTILGPLGVR